MSTLANVGVWLIQSAFSCKTQHQPLIDVGYQYSCVCCARWKKSIKHYGNAPLSSMSRIHQLQIHTRPLDTHARAQRHTPRPASQTTSPPTHLGALVHVFVQLGLEVVDHRLFGRSHACQPPTLILQRSNAATAAGNLRQTKKTLCVRALQSARSRCRNVGAFGRCRYIETNID